MVHDVMCIDFDINDSEKSQCHYRDRNTGVPVRLGVVHG